MSANGQELSANEAVPTISRMESASKLTLLIMSRLLKLNEFSEKARIPLENSSRYTIAENAAEQPFGKGAGTRVYVFT